MKRTDVRAICTLDYSLHACLFVGHNYGRLIIAGAKKGNSAHSARVADAN